MEAPSWRDKLGEVYCGSEDDARVYSIDVECVASGRGHKDRVVGRVAMVDSECKLVYDAIVNPALGGVGICSYLEKLTGLSKELCEERGVTFHEALRGLREKLPKNAILVGQGIGHDLEWLQLREGEDYAASFDIADIFKLRLKDKEGVPHPRYRLFSLRHTVMSTMGVDMQSSSHDPEVDASYSVKLFMKYAGCPEAHLRAVRDGITRSPATPSFAQRWCVLDGVALGSHAYYVMASARFIWEVWKKWGRRGGGGGGNGIDRTERTG